MTFWELPLKLSYLYERRGYSRYRMGKFEPYDFYMENKQFLKSEGIITFTDAEGRLMALKPDVTMSIVKSVAPDSGPRKLYYNESVFRSERGEYREINQIGLEYIGGGSDWAETETVSLAIETLAAISNEYTLDVSHMGYITAMLQAVGLRGVGADAVIEAMRRKSPEGVRMAAEQNGVSSRDAEVLLRVSAQRAELSTALSSVRPLSISKEMDSALDGLDTLRSALSITGMTVFLDFSVVNDIDYYNGLVFQGYVKGIPRPVLAGGRYDNLMRRTGKDMTAVGFALYLTSLEREMAPIADYEADILLIYGDAAVSALAAAVEALIGEGFSVRAERHGNTGIKTRRIMKLEPDGSVNVM